MPNVTVAYPPETLEMTFGEYISKKGLTQLRIAETQKYARYILLFNGGEEKQFEGEERILIKSPDVETFDMKPEMSAYEVTDAVVDAINWTSLMLSFLTMLTVIWSVTQVLWKRLLRQLKPLTSVCRQNG